MNIRQSDPARPTVAADRLRGLLEAHRVITSEFGLSSMLDRIVSAACELVGARYGALGVVAPDGSIEQFVHHGIDPTTGALIDSLPRGAFLDVPIRVRGSLFGELYLADPEADRFDADDEELLMALAATAGTAIENARLYDEARRSRDWLNASGEIARALLSDVDEAVLLDIVSRALSVAEADYACLILPTADGRLEVVVTEGIGADAFRGHVFHPKASTLGRAILAGESLRTHDMLLWADVDWSNSWNVGPAMIAPLADALGVRGAVLLMRGIGRAPFSSPDVEQACTFAAQVALALQLNDARGDAEWLRVLEDRHTIAEDLHDNVMQRLFATGVRLQMLLEQPLDPALSARLRELIVDLDETIEQIRTRVFGLRNAEPPHLRHPRGRFPRVAPSIRRSDTGAGAPV